MKWIALSERKPTAEDADENGEVLWKFEKGQTITASWGQIYCFQRATHFARLRDIELPPPAPVMPERLEFVKITSSNVVGDERSICCTNTLQKVYAGNGTRTSPTVTLYRRVEPGKRIVFEVTSERAPMKGEWFVTNNSECEICRCLVDYSIHENRTILRVVEGQEYLK